MIIDVSNNYIYHCVIAPSHSVPVWEDLVLSWQLTWEFTRWGKLVTQATSLITSNSVTMIVVWYH